ncbi:hypothetical protein E4U17_003831 [Claviceps sp. LM77 group G4]|nr:hypothetical protein E4U17_003831 [Claviceps sp. LM77 group G4]KAG6068813.1 hypothetical protein E4U33_004974 [Claviceps sp. LM78 group G4]
MSGTDATATPRRSAPGSLSTGSSPTRNAQPRGKARSVASKSPDPSITDGESEYGKDDSKIGMEDSIDADVAGHDGDDGDYGDNGDDGDDEEEEDEDEDYGNRGEEDDAAVSEAREIQYEVMTRLLPDLQKATRDLKQHIDNGDDGNGVFAVISKAKRGAFRFYTQAMNYPASQSNFIDFLLLEKSADRREPETTSIITASLAANLVHAIDCIRQILNDDPVDILSFLKDLDVAFPQLLATTSDFSSLSSLALNIRTQVFIQTLAAQPGEPDVAAAIASVFCASDDDNKDYSSHDISPNDIAGPFKSLCDIKEIGKEIQEIVPRIEQLAAVICKDKDNQGVRRLEEEYSLNALLEDVYTWCLEQYRLVKEAEGHSDASEEDVFRDALGSLPSVLDSPVKVPIERRSPGVHQ